MRVGKAPSLSGNDTATAPSIDGSVKRRQSFTAVVSSFAAYYPKKAAVGIPRLIAARKRNCNDQEDNPSLINAARSKSCSNLPATASLRASDEPLLTLILANTSFLDTTISESGERLYVIDTRGARTNICREDPVQGVAHVGSVNWADDNDADRLPSLKNSPNATIQMAHGRRYFVEEFLRRTKLSSSRLFTIPHYPHTLKWKRSGGNFKLVAAKGKSTIAVLEPAVLAAPPRIKVFETLYDHDSTRPQLEHHGVPIFLLDYMIATALLVIADKDEWLAAASGTVSSSSAHSAPFVRDEPRSIQRWRLEVATTPLGISEFGSTPPSPTEHSVIDFGLGQMERRTAHRVANEETGSSSPKSQAKRMQNSNILVTSPESFSSLEHRFPRSCTSTPVLTAHPFASEGTGDEEIESPVDEFGNRVSPLSRILPPVLGVSLGDSSPSPSPSPESESATESPRRQSTHLRTRSAESLIAAETRREPSKSLPSTPTAARLRRPSTAGSLPRAGSRPFRLLPRPPGPRPQHTATLSNPGMNTVNGDSVPPVPSLPPFAWESEGGGVGRSSGSRVLSLSSLAASPTSLPRSPLVPENAMGSSSRVTLASKLELADAAETNAGSDSLRSIRRTASEASLSASASRTPNADAPRQIERIHEVESSLLKTVQRRSIYKAPLPSSTSLLPEADAAPVPIMVPHTAPLRIRNTRTLSYNTAAPRASTSSSSSYGPGYMSPRSLSSPQSQTSIQSQARYHEFQVQNDFEMRDKFGGGVEVGLGRQRQEEDRYDRDSDPDTEYGAPPAYDSIDFSHPPIKAEWIPRPRDSIGRRNLS